MKHPLGIDTAQQATAHIDASQMSPAARVTAHYQAMVDFFEPADWSEHRQLLRLCFYDALVNHGVDPNRIQVEVPCEDGSGDVIDLRITSSRPDGETVDILLHDLDTIVWDITAAIQN